MPVTPIMTHALVCTMSLPVCQGHASMCKSMLVVKQRAMYFYDIEGDIGAFNLLSDARGEINEDIQAGCAPTKYMTVRITGHTILILSHPWFLSQATTEPELKGTAYTQQYALFLASFDARQTAAEANQLADLLVHDVVHGAPAHMLET